VATGLGNFTHRQQQGLLPADRPLRHRFDQAQLQLRLAAAQLGLGVFGGADRPGQAATV